MKNLEERMVKANLLTEADKKSFEDFMNLGLDPKERAAMYAKNGGKGLLGLSGIMGLLAYLSWKKVKKEPDSKWVSTFSLFNFSKIDIFLV